VRPLQRFDSPKGAIVCDSRHWPIVIATWIGSNDVSAVRNFFAWNDEVLERARSGSGYLLITDADDAARPPPEVRRVVATLTDQMAGDASALNLGNYVVLTSALVRGALTAMQWISRDKWATTQISGMPEAIARAFEDLARAGLQAPSTLDPSTYRRPL
jgi:hypothetical protein